MVNQPRATSDTRFDDASCACTKAIQIIPSLMSSSTGEEDDSKEKFLVFFCPYKNYMPSPTLINAKLDIWYGY